MDCGRDLIARTDDVNATITKDSSDKRSFFIQSHAYDQLLERSHRSPFELLKDMHSRVYPTLEQPRDWRILMLPHHPSEPGYGRAEAIWRADVSDRVEKATTRIQDHAARRGGRQLSTKEARAMAEFESIADRGIVGYVLHFNPTVRQVRIRTERRGGTCSAYIYLGDIQEKEKPFFQASGSDHLKAVNALRDGVHEMIISKERELWRAEKARHKRSKAEEQRPPYKP
jgi:hypothetical protein